MAIERTYIIPLRREWLKVPKYKRARKTIRALRAFLARHMKQEDLLMIKLGAKLNDAVWARGIQNPPHKLKVTVIKDDDGTVKAELFGYKYIVKKRAEKKEEEGGIAGKLKSALGGKDKEEKAEEAEAEIKEEKAAKAEKKEAKEAKHEHKKEKKEHKPAEHKKEEKKAVKKR